MLWTCTCTVRDLLNHNVYCNQNRSSLLVSLILRYMYMCTHIHVHVLVHVVMLYLLVGFHNVQARQEA